MKFSDLPVVLDPSLPPDVIEFRFPDGRRLRYPLPPERIPMATPLHVAAAEQKHKHLLDAGPNETEDQMWARAGEFTARVCYDVRQQYALLTKPGGRNCGGVDCDKIADRVTFKIYDIVTAAGSHSAAPTWADTNHVASPFDLTDPPAYTDKPPVPVEPPKPVWPPYESLGGDEGAKKISRQLEADYKRAGRPGLDGDCGNWLRRTDYDFMTGVFKTVEESITVHRAEWCAVLGIPVE